MTSLRWSPERLEHLQPAVIPVADAGKPGRAAAARPCLGAASLEVQPPVPVEPLALPDLLDRHVVGVRERAPRCGTRCPGRTARRGPACRRSAARTARRRAPSARSAASCRDADRAPAELDVVLSSHVRNLRVITSSTPTSSIQKSTAASSFPSICSCRMIDTTIRVGA